MKHLVLRVLDGLPVYVKDEHKHFVELLNVYYTLEAQPGQTLHALETHDDLLDIDVDGLERSIKELDEEFVPVQHRRAWKAFARDFNSSRGSVQSFVDLFKFVFDVPAEIENTGKRVFKTSAAIREKYHRIIVSATAVPRAGVIYQESTGVRADIVEAVKYAGVADTFEVYVKPRRGEFLIGDVSIQTGSVVTPGEIVGHAAFEVTSGQGYRIGDEVAYNGDLMQASGVVKSFYPAAIKGVSVVAGGSGYRVSDVVTIKGARGWRGEVAAVGADGEIVSVRIIDSGDDFTGDIVFRIGGTGTGGELAPVGVYGRPKTFDWEQTPFGPGTVTVESDSGTGFAATTTPYLWYPVYIQTGYNGVISVGTVITDSDVWQDTAYRVKTPANVEDWWPVVKKLLHPAGKIMGAVKTAQSSIVLSGEFTAVSEVSPV